MSDLLKRTVTAVFLILLVFCIIQFLPIELFSLILFIIIGLAVYEFIKLCQPKQYSLGLIFIFGIIIGYYFTYKTIELHLVLILILFGSGLYFLFSIKQKEYLTFFVRDIGIHFLSVFYLYFPLYFLLEIRRMGANYLFFLIFVIAFGDSGAYFIGRLFGKHKVYPVASPKKTWEGLIAAVIVASLSGWLGILIFPISVKIWKVIITAGLIGLFSQLSDPIESLFKRAVSKKDSGSLLPGHGGVLDRLDSYIFCGPLFFFLVDFLWM
jgi:phosphatidate cytidylyltransferase